MTLTEKFQEALKIPTFMPPEAHSDDNARFVGEEVLTRFQEFLRGAFPAFHKTARRWVLSPYSVVYHLPGAGDSRKAALLLAHYDVVPAEKGKWNFDPFEAEIKDGFVYGRGSLDMKSTMMCMIEAAEILCAEGDKPKRDIWFAFGGDEECGGFLGAANTAKWFKERGQRFDFILDEGSPVAENQIKGINSPFALVGIEEKGYLSLNLTVKQQPGHASIPPKIQAAAVLARALCRIAKKPFPYRLSPTVEKFFASVARFIPGIKGIVMRHARIFRITLGPLFFKLAAVNPTTEAMLKTTVAMTMLEGSAADNVLPSQVRAVVNMRLLWPWTTKAVTAFIKKAVNDKRVEISDYEPGSDPVPPNRDYLNYGWQEIKSAVTEVWPGVPVMPFIMVAITDSRHYKELSNCIFRFSPQKLNLNELNLIHGHDERISLENLHNELKFYLHLLRLL